MKQIFAKFLRVIVFMIVSCGIFVFSLYYGLNFASTTVVQKQSKLELLLPNAQQITVLRNGKNEMFESGKRLQPGDTIHTRDYDGTILKFSVDGQLRLDKFSKLEIISVDETGLKFVFRLLEGRLWLMNSYSNADVNILVDGAVVFPGQSVVFVTQIDGKADVYANSMDAVVGFLAEEYKGSEILSETSELIINTMYLPQGTSLSVYGDKVRENRSTIDKLLFSKLVKEFNYSAFDKKLLETDLWLSSNILLDKKMRTQIRDFRLQNIRTRGLKYSSLDSLNFNIDSRLLKIANLFTFSKTKVVQRDLEALYEFLYDAQYLYDFGRRNEARERLKHFADAANKIFSLYGEDFKRSYIDRVRHEYEYLSFATPGDALFDLKTVLQQVYLDSIKQSDSYLEIQYAFLIEGLNYIGYYADANQTKDLKNAYENYTSTFKRLFKENESKLIDNITLIQRQNQAMDNLFMQYPAFYRQGYFLTKLFIENKYLSLLPNDVNRLEEIQSVISGRINFLTKLQQFYLDGKVPLLDAQNIVALLFSEISRIELPKDYQVAVKGLFRERLDDFGIFSRFLGSQEYITSSVRGASPRERFERFKLDNTEKITVDDIHREISTFSRVPVNDDDFVEENIGNIGSELITNDKKASPDVEINKTKRVKRVKRGS